MQQMQKRKLVTEVKINFRLTQVDGYPPVATESVWAHSTDTVNEYVIDNIPFFAPFATLGDRITSLMDEDGALWYEATADRSDNSLIRAVLFVSERLGEVRTALRDRGCDVETLKSHDLLAVNIPRDVPLVDVQDYLSTMASQDVLDYEEAILRQ